MFGVQLFLYEALGLCAEGEGDTLVDSAKWITNDQGRLAISRVTLLASLNENICINFKMVLTKLIIT